MESILGIQKRRGWGGGGGERERERERERATSTIKMDGGET